MIVYTCITNSVDNILAFSNRHFVDLDADYIIFTDKKIEIPGWSVKLIDKSYGITKTPRWFKINSHILFPYAKRTIWIDGNQVPNGRADKIIESGPIGTFKHPKRDCIYEEFEACLRMNKDIEHNMRPQIDHYKRMNYPQRNGLAETCCMYREHTKEIREFNTLWWKQIEQYSHRDQLSFDFVAYITNTKYNIIPGSREKSKFLEFKGNH